MNTDDLAQMAALIPGLVSRIVGLAISQGNEQVTVFREHHSASSVSIRVDRWLHAEDDLHGLEARWCLGVQLSPSDGQAVAALPRLIVSQVNEAGRFVVGSNRNVEQPALASPIYFRHSLDGTRYRAVGGDDAQPSTVLLGDQHAFIGQKSQRPGLSKGSRNCANDRRYVAANGGGLGLPSKRW